MPSEVLRGKIKIIIGLGNPGTEYENTYHNIGQLFVDYLAHNAKLEFKRVNNFAFLKLKQWSLVKSLTFMNVSGLALRETIKYFDIKPQEMLVVHDDADIELGKYRLSFGRGSAGHQGVTSIIKNLKTKGFYRLRIGIRSEGKKEEMRDRRPLKAGLPRQVKAGEIVLRKIKKSDLAILENLFGMIEASYLET